MLPYWEKLLTELCDSLNRACDIFEGIDVYAHHHHEEWTLVIKVRDPLTTKLERPTKKYVRAFLLEKGYETWDYKVTEYRKRIRFNVTPVTLKPDRAPRKTPTPSPSSQ